MTTEFGTETELYLWDVHKGTYPGCFAAAMLAYEFDVMFGNKGCRDVYFLWEKGTPGNGYSGRYVLAVYKPRGCRLWRIYKRARHKEDQVVLGKYKTLEEAKTKAVAIFLLEHANGNS